MSRQANILSFDEARRVAPPRRSSAASSSRSIAKPRSDDVSTFDSPFRQAPSRGRTAAGASSRLSESRRASADRSARQPARTAARHAAEGSVRGRAVAAPHARDGVDEPRAERRASRLEALKRSRAKSKAERTFSKQYGGLNQDSDASAAGSRAAVYKGEMGAKHRQAARMQNEASGRASAKRTAFSLSRAGLSSLKSSPKFIAATAVAVCLALSCLFLYPSAQQYYLAVRQHDRLAAEYAALEERNAAIEGDVAALQTDSGVENLSHEQFGWVKEGEQTANVIGLDVSRSEESSLHANITPGSVEAPRTWYSPFLDALFGFDQGGGV